LQHKRKISTISEVLWINYAQQKETLLKSYHASASSLQVFGGDGISDRNMQMIEFKVKMDDKTYKTDKN